MSEIQKNPNPDLKDFVNLAVQSTLEKYKTHLIGKIEGINYKKAKATIKILHNQRKSIYSGGVIDYPIVICPIQLNYSQEGGLLFPIKIGSYCLLCFNDEDIETWQINGTKNNNFDNDGKRKNFERHLNNALAIPCFFYSNDLDAKEYDGTYTNLFYKETEIKLKEKITIKNQTTSLKDVLTELVNTLLSAKAVDPQTGMNPLDPITLTNLQNSLTKINLLLE